VPATTMMLVCLVAFAVVFVVLALLASAMHLITVAFPGPTTENDGAIVAAISSSVASLVPGARVTRIEEES
jgi:hypothetical protein